MEYIPAKYILIRTKSTAWFGTDHTMNLYRGCCHGCLYCDSRSDCYHIPDFDRVTAKADALPLLRDELARKVRPAFISMGSMSDPYNPFEKELLLTRHALELIDAYDCGVLLMPVLPFLEDRPEQVLEVVDRAADAGARFVYPGFGVTMRQGQREHFLRQLDLAFPDQNLSQRYLARYGNRYQCPSPRARQLWEVFTRRCQDRGLLYQMPRIISAATQNYGDRQLSFFS